MVDMPVVRGTVDVLVVSAPLATAVLRGARNVGDKKGKYDDGVVCGFLRSMLRAGSPRGGGDGQVSWVRSSGAKPKQVQVK
jgi:hypothetical protein